MDAHSSRKVFSKFATGVCILMFHDIELEQYVGLTINSFSSVSLEPVLISFSIKTKSRFFENVQRIDHFSLNILSRNQIDLAKRCTVSGGGLLSQDEIIDKGFPFITNAMASIWCRKKSEYHEGDHTLQVCRVQDMRMDESNLEPLVFYNSLFASITVKANAQLHRELIT